MQSVYNDMWLYHEREELINVFRNALENIKKEILSRPAATKKVHSQGTNFILLFNTHRPYICLDELPSI